MRLSFTLICALAAPILVLAVAPAAADEGLWLPDAFPSARVEKAYGFAPSEAWLDHLRLASVRLARGCSGSFVSPHGLVQTNHHCARDCIAQLSTATEDLVESGFYAKTRSRTSANVPTSRSTSSSRSPTSPRASMRATAGRDGNARAEAERAAEAAIARECEGGDAAIRCDVVALYSGAIYQLYRYRRYLDVRLVFAPEIAIATFGGDLDNYEFPRYVLDVTYLRVYVDGRPLDTSANFLRYAARDVRPGRAHLHVRQSGSDQPARHRRPARLRARRHPAAQSLLLFGAARAAHGVWRDQRRECAALPKRCSSTSRTRVKDGKGRFYALADPAIITARAGRGEGAARQGRRRSAPLRAIRPGVGQYPARRSTASAPCATAMSSPRAASGSARLCSASPETLVRHADEAGKPDGQRLREFTDANFPAQRQALASDAPIYPELEKLTLAFSLARLREALGADDPFVRKVLGTKRAGGRRRRARRQDEARRRRAAPPPDRCRRGDHRRERRSDDRVRAQDRPRSARRAPRL